MHEDGQSSCSCGGETPCGTCGGGIGADHPAAQALDWADDLASDVHDPYWRSAKRRQVFRDAPAWSEEPGWSALDRIALRSEYLVSAVSQGRNAPEAAAWLAADPGIALDPFSAEMSSPSDTRVARTPMDPEPRVSDDAPGQRDGPGDGPIRWGKDKGPKGPQKKPKWADSPTLQCRCAADGIDFKLEKIASETEEKWRLTIIVAYHLFTVLVPWSTTYGLFPCVVEWWEWLSLEASVKTVFGDPISVPERWCEVASEPLQGRFLSAQTQYYLAQGDDERDRFRGGPCYGSKWLGHGPKMRRTFFTDYPTIYHGADRFFYQVFRHWGYNSVDRSPSWPKNVAVNWFESSGASRPYSSEIVSPMARKWFEDRAIVAFINGTVSIRDGKWSFPPPPFPWPPNFYKWGRRSDYGGTQPLPFIERSGTPRIQPRVFP